MKIAETEQLQLAAQSVGMSQPAASRILHELEQQFGVTFFDRHPTGMEVTPAGTVFLRHARSALTELTTMSSELDLLKSGHSGTVRVGAVTGPAVGHLMPAVHAVWENAPGLHISVDVAPSAQLFRGLEEARYDFILGRADPRGDPNRYRFHPGRKETVRLMVHASHDLAQQHDVKLDDLLAYPWVIQEEGNPIRSVVEEAFHKQGLPVPSRIINSSSLLVALAQIERGQVISPQTEEVVRLLTSDQLGANVTAIATREPIDVAPYFLIQDAGRKLTQAAKTVMHEVLARF